jgi:V/A-type H+/Na+-transporting ATPase subunit K
MNITVDFVGYVAALAFSALGSALGIGIAGMAAIGAWKKCFMQNKPAPFLLLAFIGAPLSQTIYGMILMNSISAAANTDPMSKMFTGILGGIAIGASALYQGKIGANGSDALAETGKGFGNYIMAVGIIETVALFVLVFLLSTLK